MPYKSRAEVQAAIQRHRAELVEKPNVIGLAPGKQVKRGKVVSHTGEALVVFVRRKVPLQALKAEDRVPDEVDGIDTDVVEMDPPVVQHRQKHRPAPGGVSVGHFRVSAGTLGAVVRDLRTGGLVILSNNHVIADTNKGRAGDPICQPGAADFGTSHDTIASLGRYVPIRMLDDGTGCFLARTAAAVANGLARLFGRRTRVEVKPLPLETDGNLVDAALGIPVDEADLIQTQYNLGVIGGTAEGMVGDPVVKAGRTTGVTRDQILYVGAELEVGMGDGRTAWFVDQLVCGRMSQGGDSGSVVCLEGGVTLKAVGLLFAGSTTHTIANRIQHVMALLEIDFGED